MSKELTVSEQIQSLVVVSQNFIGKVQEHDVRLLALESDTAAIKEQVKRIPMDYRKRQALGKHGRRHITELLGYKSEEYNRNYRSYISHMWHDFQDRFGVPSYTELPADKYDDGIDFIDEWRPLKLAIDNESKRRQEALDALVTAHNETAATAK